MLRRVFGEGAYANVALNEALSQERLVGRDARFVTALVDGVCRWQGTYDAIIEAAGGRALGTLQPSVVDLLRLGAHEILGLRVPIAAAVTTTVDLAALRVGERVTGVVNAILRKVAAHDLDGWIAELGPGRDGIDRLALATAHPRWIAEVYTGLLGGDEARLALEANNEPAPTTLAVRPGLMTIDDLIAEINALGSDPFAQRERSISIDSPTDSPLGSSIQEKRGDEDPREDEPEEDVTESREGEAGKDNADGPSVAGPGAASPGRWSPLAVTITGDPGRLAAVREGRAGVQDEGSQLMALALARLDAPAGPWLDLCAGPGGKAALLAGFAHERGDWLLANERHPHRAALVAQAVRSYPFPVPVVAGDGTRPTWREGSFARVLVDAPCTGLGALRRRSDARWRKTPGDLSELHDLQVRLLDVALDSLVPGGVAAYVTCSPHPVETVDVVAEVLAQRDDVELLDASDLFDGVPGAARGEAGSDFGPYAQLWPHRHGTDAMFGAFLRRQ